MTADEFAIVWRYMCKAFDLKEHVKTPELTARWKVQLEGICATQTEALDAAKQMPTPEYTSQANYIKPLIERIKLNRSEACRPHRPESPEQSPWTPELLAAFRKWLAVFKATTAGGQTRQGAVTLSEATVEFLSRPDTDPAVRHGAERDLEKCRRKLAEHGDGPIGGNVSVGAGLCRVAARGADAQKQLTELERMVADGRGEPEARALIDIGKGSELNQPLPAGDAKHKGDGILEVGHGK